MMNSNTGQANCSNQYPPEPQTVDAAMVQSSTETQTIARNIADRRVFLDVAPHGATAPFKGESVLILYGTATGNSEALRQTGLTARVRDMAHCQASVFTQANCCAGRDEHIRGRRTARRRCSVLASRGARSQSRSPRGEIFRARSRQHHLRPFLQARPRLRRRPGAPRRA